MRCLAIVLTAIAVIACQPVRPSAPPPATARAAADGAAHPTVNASPTLHRRAH